MIFVHTGAIDEEYVKALAVHINMLEPKDTLYHYIESEGGLYYCAATALNMLNRIKDRVIYIAMGEAFSAAFHMLFKFEGKRELIEGTVGGIHQRYRDAMVTSDGKVKRLGHNHAEWRKDDRCNLQEDLEFISSLGLTPQQIKAFKDRKDIAFNSRDFKQLLQNQIKNVSKQQTTKGTRKTSKRSVSRKSSSR